jgi:ABC-type sugar transport system permease subunit
MSLLAAGGGLSGIYINRHYRTKLKLGNFARISTYIPIVALPAMVSAVFHHQVSDPQFRQISSTLTGYVFAVCQHRRDASEDPLSCLCTNEGCSSTNIYKCHLSCSLSTISNFYSKYTLYWIFNKSL